MLPVFEVSTIKNMMLMVKVNHRNIAPKSNIKGEELVRRTVTC